MTEAKSTQPQLPPRSKVTPLTAGNWTIDEWNTAEAAVFEMRCKYPPDSLSAIFRDIAINLRAENESLKAQLGQCYILTGADPDIDADEPWRLAPYAVREVKRLREESDEAEAERDKYKNEANQLRLAFVLSDAILPAEFEPTLPPTKRLHVYINKALEVIREYRDNASGHGCNCEYFKDDTCEDDTRCSTCIKADELLSREDK